MERDRENVMNRTEEHLKECEEKDQLKKQDKGAGRLLTVDADLNRSSHLYQK